jgi:xanthine dehydrogenase small subunit
LIRFILNEKEISTDLPPGELLLDFIRYHEYLMGTKIGCREGDCGACTVLIGEIKNGELQYQSVTSCLVALGNVHGKHVVTIEGINMDQLNPLQHAMSEEGATQCGFCTPGFVVSLAGFCLSQKEPCYNNAIASINGNICRCTGYKSIERAAAGITKLMEERKGGDAIKFVTMQNILPVYFGSVKQKLNKLLSDTNGSLTEKNAEKFLGGGTDLYVQQPEAMSTADIHFLFGQEDLKGIFKQGNKCVIGAACTATDLAESSILRNYFPGISGYIKLIASTPIRNMATFGGNLVNASPIGDFTIFFLALNAQLVLSDNEQKRELPLRKFYKAYKVIDKKPGEFIEKIWFELPDENALFNFEKVSKRTHLDIAGVNSAISIKTDGKTITSASVSAGGVAPVPCYLSKASAFLKNKILSEKIIDKTIEIAQSEISPISDARGSEEYKRLLLSQLIKAHFITLFPSLNVKMMLQIEETG